jgi:glutamate synthase (NADPH/NADH) large chain
MAKTLLVPEAWSKKGSSAMPDAHRAMYQYSNSVMEPWDGPAALAATDGRWWRAWTAMACALSYTSPATAW